MSTSQEAILLKIAADVSGLTKGLRQGRQEMGTFQQGVSSLKGELGALAAAVGAGIGLAALAGEALAFADSVQKVHDQTGLAVESVQFLRFAAEQTGGSVDDLAKLVSKMQVQVYGATHGNKQLAQSFADFGIQLDDLRGKKPEDQLQVISARIAEIQDPSERAALAVAAFGKSGADALPELVALGEKGDELAASFELIGGAVSGDTISKVDALGDSFAQTKTAIVDLATEVVGTLAPSFISFLSTVNEVVGGLRLLDGQGDNAIVNLDNKIADAEQTVKSLQASAYASFGGMTESTKAAIAEAEALVTTLKAQQEAQLGLGAAGAKSAKDEQGFQKLLKLNADDSFATLTASLTGEQALRDIMAGVRYEKEAASLDAETQLRIESLQNRNQLERDEAAAQDDFLRQQAADFADYVRTMGEDASAVKIQTWQQETQSIAQLLETQTAGVTRHSKAMFEINKAAGIVNTIINTVQAVTKAWSDYGWPVGAVVGAAIAAAGIAQVQAIASTQFGSKTAPSQAATPPTPTAPQGGGGGGGGGGTLHVEGVGPDSLLTGKMVRSLADKLSDHVRDGGKVEWAD